MHIRLLALGTRGDVQPYIALGLGLKRAGYDVSVAATADFVTFIESYGLTAVASKMDLQSVVRSSEQGGSHRQSKKARWAFFQMLLDETPTLAQGADTLIYAPAAVFSAPHVAEKLGIPGIPTALQPYMHPTRDFQAVGMPALDLGGWYNRFSYTLLEWFTGTFIGPKINRWREKVLGLPPNKGGIFAGVNRDDVTALYGFSPSVMPKPAEWGDNVHVTGYWFLDGGNWQPPAGLTAFLESGAPPIYVGFGSMANRDAQQTTEIVIDAVRKAGVRAVLASGWGGLSATNVPESVYLINSAPHEWLFPRMGAVVHHGGAGTTAAGLRAGIPSIIVPFKNDQPFWGKRVEELGVGPTPIPHKRLSADNLAQAMRQAITDQTMRRNASALGEKICAEDGVGSAVRIIERVIEGQKVR